MNPAASDVVREVGRLLRHPFTGASALIRASKVFDIPATHNDFVYSPRKLDESQDQQPSQSCES